MEVSSVTRRQHYVWKHYLQAWEQHGRVCVRRKDGRQFETSPDNVAVMRDFYRLPVLLEEDEAFIVRYIDRIERPSLRKLALGWLDAIAAPSRLRRFLEQRGVQEDEILAAIARVEIQSEESFHSSIEGDAVRLLDELRRGSNDLWQIDSDARDFAFFISLQHLRTKRIQDLIAAGYADGPEREAAIRRWPVLRLVSATNMGWCFFAERAVWRLRVLHAPGCNSFITSDQPTRNLLAGDSHNSLALFYPIGPRKAVLLEHIENESVVGEGDNLSDERIDELNRKTYDYSHEQAFGTDLTYLATLGAPTQ